MTTHSRLLACVPLVVLAVTVSPGVAHADIINVISQSYHIHGAGMGLPSRGFPSSQTLDYDQTSNSPLSRHEDVLINNPVPGGIGFTGEFFLDTVAKGEIKATSAFVEASTNKDDIGDALAIAADASASITFKALQTLLIVKTEHELEWSIGFSGIYDETTGTPLLQFGPAFTAFESVVSFDLDHIYTLRAASVGFGSGEHGARIALQTVVPEAEGIATFLIVGLSGLLLRQSMDRSKN